MKQLVRGGTALSILFGATLLAQPVIQSGGVLDGAAYTADIAQGSVFVVKGTGLSAPGYVAAPAPNYPATLNNVQITFTPAAGGTAVQARMVYTYNQSGVNQLAAVLPSTTAVGDYDVRVINAGATSAAARSKVVARKPGIVTASGSGAGPAQATLAGALILQRFAAAGKLGDFDTRPGRAGERVDLWGTGLGPDVASDTGGTSGDQTAAGSVRVLVAGQEVTPLYAGRSQGFPGLDQIVFMMPANVQPSCYVPVQVRAGGVLGNSTTIAVAAGSSCSHPTLTEDQLRKLSLGGALVSGNFVVASVGTEISIPGFPISITSWAETIGGSFSRYTQDMVSGGFYGFTVGACTVTKMTGTMTDLTLGTAPSALDAGNPLVATQPSGATVNLPKGDSNVYNATLGTAGGQSKTLQPGLYRLRGPGGSQVGAFDTSTNVPAFDWTNRNTVSGTINRSQSLPLTWTGGTPGWVEATGFSGRIISGDFNQDPTKVVLEAAVFVCIAQGSAGQMTVPSSVLQQLPAVTFDANNPTGVGMFSVLAVGDGTQGKFTAPLVGGGAIDSGYFSYSVGNAKFVSYQ